MNNNTAIAFLALFGLIAVAAVGVTAVLVTRRGIATENSNQFAYAEPVYGEPVYGEPVYGEPVEAQVPLAVPVLYQNKEEWEIVRGPDRLIEKVVIHRMVTQNG
ncbi:unnamed protein product [marine sediment metagenome]|uniref:Uncharacterized protein n=1 Tax=marine sediment metagenome TaxID=412755 RepID=X1PXM7_9ZZZZ